MFASKDLFLTTPQGYQISRSVRLRSSASAYFNRTPASTTNQKTWTFSAWTKRGSVFNAGNNLFCSFLGGGNRYTNIQFDANSCLYVNSGVYTTGGTTTTAYEYTSSAVYRDPSAWYHIVVAIDTTQATASNRVKIYVNGSQVTAFTTSTQPAQNTDTFINSSANTHYIGQIGNGSGYTDGYLTEINFIDGQQLTPTSFGQFNSVTGVWQPLKYTGTYGTNGFYLNFSDNSNNTATTIGKDYSGNGNNWTPNNISVTSGVTYDSMIDVPTLYADGGNGRGNYAVLNPLFAAGTVSDGNLKHTASTTTWVNTSSTIFVSSGKWYFEATNIAGNYTMIGVATNSASTSQNYATATNTWTYFNDGTKYGNGATATAYGASYTTGNVIGVALDMDAGTLTFYKDGVSQGTAFSTGLAGLSLCPWFGSYTSGNGVNVNFGQRPFAYTPPSGFVALNTQNLPAPTISNGGKYMAATLYTGNGSTQTVNNSAGFYPDFNWIKNRSSAGSHVLVNSVVGGTKQLFSNLTDAEQTNTNITNGISGSGIALGNNSTGTGSTNQNADTYVLWQWLAGSGSTSSNTSGSITSTVSVNATAGFSVVTFNAGSAGNQSFGHGLGVAPNMVILKDRANAVAWPVYHSSAVSATNQYLVLNLTAATQTSSGIWGAALPTSTVVGFGSNVAVTANANCVAYCFSAVRGYSAFGSYTGNGSTDGPFVYLGFRPRFIMTKRTDTTGPWQIIDTSRDTYNSGINGLFPNTSGAEASFTQPNGIDFLSNGFKLRNSSTDDNASGGTYVYACFAENPYKLALAR